MVTVRRDDGDTRGENIDVVVCREEKRCSPLRVSQPSLVLMRGRAQGKRFRPLDQTSSSHQHQIYVNAINRQLR
jgi:hypothetical protein